VPFPNASNTTAYGLTNQGQIVGSYNIGATQNLHGFVLDGGQFTAIDVPFANGSQTQPFGVNGKDQIVGGYFLTTIGRGAEQGFLKSGSAFTSIEYPLAEITDASGINNAGEIVGDYLDANLAQHGFVAEDGMFQSINVPSAPSGTVAFGINDLGQIVGDYFTGGRDHGFLLDAGVFSTIDVPFLGSSDTVVRGINNQGDLVGLYSDSQGDHGFLASPQTTVPEPSSLLFLGFGAAALAGLSAYSRMRGPSRVSIH
jgi:uncharacterized membrane protein